MNANIKGLSGTPGRSEEHHVDRNAGAKEGSGINTALSVFLGC